MPSIKIPSKLYNQWFGAYKQWDRLARAACDIRIHRTPEGAMINGQFNWFNAYDRGKYVEYFFSRRHTTPTVGRMD